MKILVQIFLKTLKYSSGGAERHYRGGCAKSEPEIALLGTAPSNGWERSGLPSPQLEKSLYLHPESLSPLCLALLFQFQCLGLLPSALPLTDRSHRVPDANNTEVFVEACSLGDFLNESSYVFFSPQVRP